MPLQGNIEDIKMKLQEQPGNNEEQAGTSSAKFGISILFFCIALLSVSQSYAACEIEKYAFGSDLEDVEKDLFPQFPMGHGVERYLTLDGKETCPLDERMWGVPITLVFNYDKLVQYQIIHPVDGPRLNSWVEDSYSVELGIMPGLTASLPNAQKAWDLGDVTVLYSITPRPGELIEYIEITSIKYAELIKKQNSEAEE